jgi:hypothetical protein
VFASRFDAKGLKARWILFTVGVRLRRAALASPGSLGVSLRAHPFAGHYYTVSLWLDESSLLTFARSLEHAAAVKQITALGDVSGVLISRNTGSSRPRWRDIVQWIAETKPGPYRMESKVPVPVLSQRSEATMVIPARGD